MTTVALIGNIGNSVLVRGGLEVLFDATADALRRIGVRVLTRLEATDDVPDVFHFFGSFYGLEDAFDSAKGHPRVVSPLLLLSDDSLALWRAPLDVARSRLPWSMLNARHRMLRGADAVMPNSEEEAENSRRYGARSTDILRCGVDLDLFVPNPPPIDALPAEWRDRAARWAALGPRVISVGRFERRKNQVEVAQACAKLGLPVMFIGRRSPTEHGYADELRARSPNPEFLWEDAPWEVLRWAMASSNVHVLATRHETIGLVSLEAAATGARPVAVNQPTSREYLGRFGELSPSPEPAHLAAAIDRALRRGRLTESERALLEPLSWTTFARSTLAVYERVLR
jgi:glycosyltransferase involved in cell wall biosynthesis